MKFDSNDRKPLRVCQYCLQEIESHEGRQRYKTTYVDEDDLEESKCDWCEETGNDVLYEIVPERPRKSKKIRSNTMIKYPKSKKVMASNTKENPLAEIAKEPILEFPDGSYLYVKWNNGKLTAGGVTNTGMIPEYEMDYDSDISVDQNLNNFYDYIIEQTPELMDEVESATHPITAATRAKKDISGLADEIVDGLENLLIALRSVPNPEEYYDDNDLDDIQRVIDRLNDISMKWDYDWERN